jgi:hypothetical protein
VRVTGGKRPRTALDVYNVVVRYPQPPVHVRREGQRIVWDQPPNHREIRGFNLYHSGDSGMGFTRVNAGPIEALEYPLPAAAATGYYVLTSVEHSHLESRRFSEELAVDADNAPFRHFYEAEQGELTQPMAPVFDAPGCSDGYAVAVQDHDLLWKARLAAGQMGRGAMQVRVPNQAPCRLLARVRTLKPGLSGDIEFVIHGKSAGRVHVDAVQWRWVAINDAPLAFPPGESRLSFATGTTNIALDNICITSDLAFTPSGKGNSPHRPPAAPRDLRRGEPNDADNAQLPPGAPGRPPFVKLIWSASSAPQGVCYYNVYRGDQPRLEAAVETRIGSPSEPAFLDCGLSGRTYCYRVTAVDAWGNESAASEAFTYRPAPP